MESTKLQTQQSANRWSSGRKVERAHTPHTMLSSRAMAEIFGNFTRLATKLKFLKSMRRIPLYAYISFDLCVSVRVSVAADMRIWIRIRIHL